MRGPPILSRVSHPQPTINSVACPAMHSLHCRTLGEQHHPWGVPLCLQFYAVHVPCRRPGILVLVNDVDWELTCAPSILAAETC